MKNQLRHNKPVAKTVSPAPRAGAIRGSRFGLAVALLFLAGLVSGWMAVNVTPPASAAAPPHSPESQKVFDTKVKPFLEAHCVKCHNDKETRAGFRIDNLGTDFLAGKTADHWKEIYDNIGLGKMPPKKEARPKESEAAAVMGWIDQEIRNAERLSKNSSGRTRRLNRTEYFNTLRDLFDVDENYVRSLEDELPPDGKVDGFDRVGTSLYIDQSQLAKYFELAERVLTQKVLAPQPKATVPAKDFARNMRWGRESQDGKLTKLTAIGPFGELFFPPNSWNRTLAMIPTGARIYELNNGGIEYLAGGFDSPIGSHGDWSASGAGGGSWTDQVGNFFFRATQEGTYRLKFRAGAFAGKGKYALENVKLMFQFGKNGEQVNVDRGSVIIDAPLDQPKDYVLEIYLHPRPEVSGNNMARLTWNGVRAGAQEVVRGVVVQTGLILSVPELHKLEWELVNEHYRIASEEKKKGTPAARINEILTSRFAEVNDKHNKFVQAYVEAKKPAFVYNPDYDLQSIPRLWLESWEVEGPIIEWPPKGRRKLFFAGEERPIDDAYIRDIFARFLPRAYRRAVEPEEINDWVAWVLRAQQDYKLSGLDAVKEGVKAVLCSPGFLFIIQETRAAANKPQLTDYELASRLSYFLWSTMPDDELFKLAADNKLHEPKTLEAQVRRMIADPKGMGLVRNFTGQWLQVRDFGNTMTDRNQYRSYTDELRKSSWQEPYEFFKEILRSDLSIINFVDSDFLVIDQQLANHYGIDGVKEVDGFKKVAIRPEQHRGGVLGMAGVLTYLSDGFRTLPVRRAAYVMDTLWNEPPKPPPPNAGDLPPVKGKDLTVRQRLEQHRNSAICASCHAHLDPFGVALENYDAIGLWRERQNGEGFRGDDKSPPLDVSGVLPSGREFKDLKEYKQALLAERDRFVRGFTKKMLTYALGRSVGATDEKTVAEIVKAVERDNYRMQSLVQAIVASEAFRMK